MMLTEVELLNRVHGADAMRRMVLRELTQTIAWHRTRNDVDLQDLLTSIDVHLRRYLNSGSCITSAITLTKENESADRE